MAENTLGPPDFNPPSDGHLTWLNAVYTFVDTQKPIWLRPPPDRKEKNHETLYRRQQCQNQKTSSRIGSSQTASSRALEWDEDKRKATLEKHGIDFVAATRIFSKPVPVARSDRSEPRWMAVGIVDEIWITVIYTIREEDVCRIITARRARDNERREHYKDDSGRSDPSKE